MSILKKLMISLLAVSCATVGAAPSAEKATTLVWNVSLSAEGRVTALIPVGEGIDVLRHRLEPIIRGWEFVPGQLDGEPAATDTQLFVELALAPSADGGDYSVRINDARTGGSVNKATPPRMSRTAMEELMRRRPGAAAMVAIEVSFDASGGVIESTIVPTSPVQTGVLASAAKKAVDHWTYTPERVAGVGVPGRVIVPICFAIASSAAEARSKSADCRWTKPGTNVTVNEGQSLALDSRVQIKSNVIGSAP